MNDILLSPQAAHHAEGEGFREWVHDGEPKGLRAQYERKAICRAQVAKVVEWIQDECTAHNIAGYEPREPVYRYECDECMDELNDMRQALCAAGGE